MSNRVKDNAKTLSIITEDLAKDKNEKGMSEDITCCNLSIMAAVLADISISLAVIADHLDKEDNKQ